MRNTIFTFLLLLFSFAGFAQDEQEKSFNEQIEEMSKKMEEAINSLDQAFEDSRLEMEKLNLGKTEEPGQLRIYSDTLDFKQLFDMMEQNWSEIPFLGQEIPKEFGEDLRENALQLPDLLLRSTELFENSDLESMFEDLMKQLEENGELFRPVPAPKKGKVIKT